MYFNISQYSNDSSSQNRLAVRIFVCFAWTFILLTGCSQSGQPDADQDENPVNEVVLDEITVLIIGDEKVGPTIQRQWAARRDGKLKVLNKTQREFESDDFALDDNIDVIIYPPALIGELVSRSRIAEIPRAVWSDTEQLNSKELLRHARSTSVRTGRSTWAVPLGSPQLVMFYRRDVLEELETSVPETWEEFDALVQKLRNTQTLSDGSGNNLPTAVGIPLKNGWAGRIFVSRVAAYVRARGKLSILFDRDSMEPLIETQPFVEALTNLKANLQGNNNDSSNWKTAKEIYLEMVNGRLAVALSWPSSQFTQSEDGSGFDQSKVIDAIEIARLPGSFRWFDGGDTGWAARDKMDSPHVDVIGFDGLIASVNQKSGHSLTAHEFLKWLPSKAISLTTMTESSRSGPFRASHLGDLTRWTGDAISPETSQQYGDVIQQINQESVAFVFPRIPGHSRYLNALDAAIEKCLRGELEPLAALKEAAEKWREITTELDAKTQRANLRRDEGI